MMLKIAKVHFNLRKLFNTIWKLIFDSFLHIDRQYIITSFWNTETSKKTPKLYSNKKTDHY